MRKLLSIGLFLICSGGAVDAMYKVDLDLAKYKIEKPKVLVKPKAFKLYKLDFRFNVKSFESRFKYIPYNPFK